MKKMNNCGIYAIINKVNGHQYIGSSVNIHNRWRAHLCNLRHGNGSTYLQRAWDKYGESSFEFVFLLECQKDDLHKIEQLHFDVCKPEYNLAPIAGGGSLPGVHKGMVVSEETRIKLSIAGKKRPGNNSGNKASEETKIKMSLSHKGENCSAETRSKMSITRKGRPQSEKSRIGLIAANTGRHLSEEHREKISLARKGKAGHPMSDENKRKLLDANRNRIITDDLRAKLGRAHLGQKHSAEARAKMSLSRKKYLAREVKSNNDKIENDNQEIHNDRT